MLCSSANKSRTASVEPIQKLAYPAVSVSITLLGSQRARSSQGKDTHKKTVATLKGGLLFCIRVPCIYTDMYSM